MTYIHIGRPVSVPDKTGMTYVHVGRDFNPGMLNSSQLTEAGIEIPAYEKG